MTRRLLVLVVLATVVLAGCTGGPGAETTVETTDGGDGTTSPTGDGESADLSGEAVPGVSGGSLTNASALARANEAAFSETGGELRISRSDGPESNEYRLVAGAALSTYALSGTRPAGDGQMATVELWSNETTRFVRSQADGETNYRTAERRHDRLNVLEITEEYLAAGAFTVANESTGNGTVVLTATEADQTTADRGPLADVSSVDGTLVVDGDGRIHHLSVSAVAGDESVTYSYDLVRTGIDRVAPPDWFGDVPASATLDPRLFVTVENDSHLLVRHEGGDHVPANVTLSLSNNGTTGTATFESALDDGDARYAYFENTTDEFVVSTDPPSFESVDPLSSPVSVTITTDDGVDLYSGSMAWASETASAPERGSSGGSASGSGGSASGGSSTASGATATADAGS